MTDVRMYRLSTRYVYATVASSTDPSADDVWMAVKPVNVPAGDSDLHVAEWVPGETWTNGKRRARLLVGPESDLILDPGNYRVYYKTDLDPEVPFERDAYRLVVTSDSGPVPPTTPELAAVAFSGAYADLTGRPSAGASTSLPLFDVEAYGAVGDGTTDDYVAIRAAWDAMLGSSVGGLLYFPRAATYRVVATPARLGPTPDNVYALFPLPMVASEDGPLKRTFGVLGVGRAATVRTASSFGAEGDAAQVATAGVLKVDYSTPFAWSPTDGLPSVIGAPDADITGHTTDNVISNMHFEASGLIIRQPDNPSMCALNLEMVSTINVDNIRIDVASVLDHVPEPTHPTGASMLAPKSNNNVAVDIGSVVIEGHYTGVPYTEHVNCASAVMLRCKIGVSNRRPCTHMGDLSRLKIEQCTFGFAGYDPAGVGPNLGVVPWYGGTVNNVSCNMEHFAYFGTKPWTYTPVNGCDFYAPDGGLSGRVYVFRVNSEPASPAGIGVAPFGGSASAYVRGPLDGGTGFSDFGIYTASGGVAQRLLGTAPSNPVVDPPDTPTIGTATAGVQSASVAFTPAASGPAATSYTATSTPGGVTASGSSSPIVVPGLTAGTPYTFTVHATNAVGSSAESAASNQVTPTAPVSLPSDTFDGTGALVTSTSGHTYSGNADASWIRSSGSAVHASSGTAWTNVAWLAAQANCAVEMTFLAVDSLEAGPVARVTDADNLLYMDLIFSGTQVAVELYRRIAGSFAGNAFGNGGGGAVTVTGLTPGAPVTVRLECEGSAIRAYVNGVLTTSGTDTTQSGTGVGMMWGAAAVATVDSLVATAL